MTERYDPNQNTSTAGLGERRRRREAERARARAAGQSVDPPLTRRERRARDEALASGALMLGPNGLVPTGEFTALRDPESARPETEQTQDVPPAEDAVQTGDRAGAGEVRADSAPVADEGQTDEGQTGQARATRATPDSDAALPVRDRAQQQSGAGTASGADFPDTRAGRRARRAADAAAREAAAGAADSSEVTRRSLRSKQAEAPAPAQMPAEEESPPQPSATGRRPVVRPPSAARGTRSVDQSTGGLTAIQRAVREANTSGAGIPTEEPGQESDSPSSWGSAVDLPTVTEDVNEHGREETQAMSAVPRVPVRDSQFPDSPGESSAEEGPAGQDSAEEDLAEEASAEEDLAQVAPDEPSATGVTPREESPEAAPAIEGTAVEADDGREEQTGPDQQDLSDPGPGAPRSPTTASPSAASAEEDDDTGAFDMKPRWESLISGVEPAKPEQPAAERPPGPLRVSARAENRGAESGSAPDQPVDDEPRFAQDPEAEDLEDEARKTPRWLFALQMLVLVLVAAILGVLVYQLGWGDLFDDEGALGGRFALPAGQFLGRWAA
ncbi:MAG TPA: hypothetical protein VK095_03560 [Beutenbergiaceae bacterium]|nr:hypothetical protein [Beutenbergiaceae bacterium]